MANASAAANQLSSSVNVCYEVEDDEHNQNSDAGPDDSSGNGPKEPSIRETSGIKIEESVEDRAQEDAATPEPSMIGKVKEKICQVKDMMTKEKRHGDGHILDEGGDPDPMLHYQLAAASAPRQSN